MLSPTPPCSQASWMKWSSECPMPKSEARRMQKGRMTFLLSENQQNFQVFLFLLLASQTHWLPTGDPMAHPCCTLPRPADFDSLRPSDTQPQDTPSYPGSALSSSEGEGMSVISGVFLIPHSTLLFSRGSSGSKVLTFYSTPSPWK